MYFTLPVIKLRKKKQPSEIFTSFRMAVITETKDNTW